LWEDLIFRILFGVLWFVFLIVRGVFGRKARTPGLKRTRQERWEAATKYESGILVLLRLILMVFLIGFILIYAILPSWIAWAQLPVYSLLRWIGVVMGVIAILLIAWVGNILGKHVSGQLELREKHQLVTTGPYRRIRHPMYSVYLFFNIAMLLVAANGLLILLILLGLLLLIGRIKAEEQMLLEQFGEKYRAYQKQTGLLFPKFRQKPDED
jgi:protein-S-isoprenylcysteine O-methyltransferase Ste14